MQNDSAFMVFVSCRLLVLFDYGTSGRCLHREELPPLAVQLNGCNMTQSAQSIASIRKRLYDAIPDGATVKWPDLLEKSGDMRAQVESLAFGKPDSVSRRGDRFTCRGKVSAQMPPRHGFTAFADKEVCFTVGGSGERLVISNITGVKVQPPVGFKFTMNEVVISTDGKGNFTLGTSKFGVSITVTLDPEGEFLGFRFGK